MASILVIDDSRSMRNMVSHTLKQANYIVTEAPDGTDAYELAKVTVFDLIVSDVNMPKMDGITLVRHLREMDTYRFVPILMLTTETSEVRKQEARDAGATGWIVKPFVPEKLLAAIKRVLG